jgi:DNA-binding CsgD family transcriptional regulator
MSADLALTIRQSQVLGFLSMGLTAAEIGGRLAISPRTARAHIEVLKQKLGAARARELPMAYRRATGLDPVALVLEVDARR